MLVVIFLINMWLGMIVLYFGVWVLFRGVEEGVVDGEILVDEDFNKKYENILKLWCFINNCYIFF